MKTYQLVERNSIPKSPIHIDDITLRGLRHTFPAAGLAIDSGFQLQNVLEFERKVKQNYNDDLTYVSLIDVPLSIGQKVIGQVKPTHKSLLKDKILMGIPYTELFFRQNKKIENNLPSNMGPILKSLYAKTRIRTKDSRLARQNKVIGFMNSLSTRQKRVLLGEGFELQTYANIWLPVTPPIYDQNSLAIAFDLNELMRSTLPLFVSHRQDFAFYFNFHSELFDSKQEIITTTDAIVDFLEDVINAYPEDRLPVGVVIKITDDKTITNQIRIKNLKYLVENLQQSLRYYGLLMHFARSDNFGYLSLFKGVTSYSVPTNLQPSLNEAGGGYIPPKKYNVYDSDTFTPLKFGDYIDKIQDNNETIPLNYVQNLYGGYSGMVNILESKNTRLFSDFKTASIYEANNNHVKEFINEYVTSGNHKMALKEVLRRVKKPVTSNYIV